MSIDGDAAAPQAGAPTDALAALARHAALLRALARPSAWPEALAPGTRIERIETPISSLLLGGAHVLKLKKPVRLPFVDFSTPARRRHFCHEELRLNRRTAPALYLAVRPVLGPAQAPRVGAADAPAPQDPAAPAPAGAGEVLDWAVWMRRFDARAGFDRMAAEGRLRASHVDRLGDAIARLHAGESPSPATFGDPDRLVEVVAANLRELLPLAAAGGPALVDPVRALAAWSAARGAALRPLLAARRARGAVVEGHGDLHLGNVVWHRGHALPFDALEFEPALRHADRLADLAFPFMDLIGHGRPRLAWRLLARVLDASGDHDGLPLLRWLAAHRALVRAKVALLSAAQGHDAEAQRAAARQRIALAQALARPGPAPLVLTCGLSGSGKSTVALRLAEALGALRVRSDVERKRLHGLAPTARVDDPARLYGAEATQRTYARLLEIAQDALAGGVGVVLDAAYLRRDERRQAQALAAALGAPFAIVECRAPLAVLRARIRQRQAGGRDPSDADLAVLERQRRWAEPPAAGEPAHRLDSAGSRAAVARATDAWAARFAARHGLTATATHGRDAPASPGRPID